MDLRTAIERTVRFCPKGTKALETLQAVRFLPERSDIAGAVYSTSGHLGTLVELRGVDLPDALLSANALRKAIKGARSVDSITETKPGIFDLTVTPKKTGSQVSYEVPSHARDSFPNFPMMPVAALFEDIPDWERVLKVLPAVGKKEHEPDLKAVRFHPQHVTATNLDWLIRVNRGFGWDGRILADVFRSWPKGPVCVAWEKPYAFFRVGEETRFAALQTETHYHDSHGRYCEYVPPYLAVVNKASLEDTIKRAQDVSPWRMVSAEFGALGVTVRAYARNRESDADAAFAVDIPYERASTAGMTFLLDSVMLGQALKLFDTPNIRIRFEAPDQPVHLESAELQVIISSSAWESKNGR